MKSKFFLSCLFVMSIGLASVFGARNLQQRKLLKLQQDKKHWWRVKTIRFISLKDQDYQVEVSLFRPSYESMDLRYFHHYPIGAMDDLLCYHLI